MPANVVEERMLVEVAGTDVNMVCHIIGSGLLTQDPTSLPLPTNSQATSQLQSLIVMISWCLK